MINRSLKLSMLTAEISLFLLNEDNDDIEIASVVNDLLSFYKEDELNKDEEVIKFFYLIQSILIKNRNSVVSKDKLLIIFNNVFENKEQSNFVAEYLFYLKDNYKTPSNDRLDQLLKLNVSSIEGYYDLEVGYYNELLTLLLHQETMDLKKINEVNNKLKKILASKSE
jgi:hypothetical protein